MRKYLYPTLSKIVLAVVIFILQFLVFGIPVLQFPFCKAGVYCSKVIVFRSFDQLSGSSEFFGRGIWFPWYIYVLQLIVSYLASCLIVYFYVKHRSSSNT